MSDLTWITADGGPGALLLATLAVSIVVNLIAAVWNAVVAVRAARWRSFLRELEARDERERSLGIDAVYPRERAATGPADRSELT